MTSERWAKVRAIVETAAEINNEQDRASFLKQSCELDEDLKIEVIRLLDFETRANSLFAIDRWNIEQENFGQGNVTSGLKCGSVVGNYRIKEEIGRGGMGVVYLAERGDGQYQNDVAIKVLRESIASPELAKHFLRERQILARLSHPGIARLLDAGVTPDALPYFVLEYVEGKRIDDFCEDGALSLRAKLELFLRVAAAVQSAHQQLVLHLDLKPGNILVTVEGEPRLLDFGIARILSENDAAAGRADSTLRLLTPRYASPEQAAGLPVGIASDVFSLGTLLYRILTGVLPYPIKDAPSPEAIRILREVAPTPPSEVAPEEIRATLRGDLDIIVLHALRKEPERRYPTVAAFADDIERYLAFEPIRAHPDTFRYRSTKFLRRNRLPVISAAAVLLILLVSGAAILRSAAIARRERATAVSRLQDVRALARSYIYDLNPQLAPIPGTLPVRAFIVKKALAYLKEMSSQTANDPHSEAELAAGYYTVGDMQANLALPQLGENAGAIESMTSAVALGKRVLAADPSNQVARTNLIAFNIGLGGAFMALGDIAKYDQFQHDAWDLGQSLIAGGPSTYSYLLAAEPAWTIGTGQSGNGDLWNSADPAAGLVWFDRAIGYYDRWLAVNSASPRLPLAISFRMRAIADRTHALQQLGRGTEARGALEAAVKQNGPRPSYTSFALRDWIDLRETYAEFLREEHHLQAASAMAEGILATETPISTLGDAAQLDRAVALSILARIDLDSGRATRGNGEMQDSLKIFQRLYTKQPESPAYSTQFAHNLFYFAEEQTLNRSVRTDLYTHALLITEAYNAKHPAALSANLLIAKTNLGLAHMDLAAHRRENQRRHAQSAIQNLFVVLAAHPVQPEANKLLAQAQDMARN